MHFRIKNMDFRRKICTLVEICTFAEKISLERLKVFKFCKKCLHRWNIYFKISATCIFNPGNPTNRLNLYIKIMYHLMKLYGFSDLRRLCFPLTDAYLPHFWVISPIFQFFGRHLTKKSKIICTKLIVKVKD